MSPTPPESSTYSHNPQHITVQALERVSEHLEDAYEHLKDAPFADILTRPFQWWRMDLGFTVDIPQDLRQKYNLKEAEISTSGLEGSEKEASLDHDQTMGAMRMRTIVALAFSEQAKLEGQPLPDINWDIIDTHPVKKSDLGHVSGSRPDMHVLDVEDLKTQWQQENPELYEYVMAAKAELVARYTPRTLAMYKGHLPDEFLEEMATEMYQAWDDYLEVYALRAYAMFTPNPPPLIPVPYN